MQLKKVKKHVLSLLLAAAVLVLTAPTAQAVLDRELVPVGEAVGITVKTRGVVVAELSELKTENGKLSPARDAGILPGDLITAVAGREITNAQELLAALEGMAGKPVTVDLVRNGAAMQLTVTPCEDGGRSFMGFWVRDGLSGIGTVTWYDPETKTFGALGHPISDGESGTILPVGEGRILPAQVTGVTKGKAGAPGKLGGSFETEKTVGDIRKNCPVGIYGQVSGEFAEAYGCGKAVPVAEEREIRVGKATILSDAGGEVREYDVEITRLYRDSGDGRSMMLKVTDEELLALTGGIVQGMSGSPILQNGCLVGAVTHVLINDPTKGYGVSAEDMLAAAA